MAKRKFEISEKQEQELIKEYLQSKDGPLRTRLQAVRMYGTGYPVQEIQALTSCSRTSLMEWCQLFRSQGVSGLKDKRRGGNRARLTPAKLGDLKVKLLQYSLAQLFGTHKLPHQTGSSGQSQTFTKRFSAGMGSNTEAVTPIPSCLPA